MYLRIFKSLIKMNIIVAMEKYRHLLKNTRVCYLRDLNLNDKFFKEFMKNLFFVSENVQPRIDARLQARLERRVISTKLMKLFSKLE